MGAKDSYLWPCSVFVLLNSLWSQCCHAAIYNVTSSQALSQGQTLISPSQIFELGFFILNNHSAANQYVGIWHKNISPRKVVWVANRENPIVVTDSAATASLTIGSNGNLNLVDGNERSVIWSTEIVGSPSPSSSNGSIAVLSDDGNLVLTDGIAGDVLWQSFDHHGDTLLPKAILGFNVETGERRGLTCWKTETDPSLGNFIVGVSPETPPQVFIWNGSNPHWRSGPWDRTRFVGVPNMDSSYRNGFKVEEGVGFSYESYNLTGSMFVISSQGVLKLLYKDQSTDWYNDFEAPYSSCDTYGVCGPFGVCNTSKSPICNCMKGFVPKSKEEWSNGNWKGGCVRQTELLCDENSTSSSNTSRTSAGKNDGFWPNRMVKLPDFHEYLEINDAKDCTTWCQSNCSCLAYAFVNGLGCLVWSRGLVDIQEFDVAGVDLFLRLAHSELVGDKQINKVVISLAAIGATAAITGAIFLACYMRRRANQKGNIKTSDTSGEILLRSAKPHDSSELATFDFDSILVATNHFTEANKLGQGGFGPVYKGKLLDGTDIAVKRLASNSGQGIVELKNEMVLISKLRHRNLVRLFGCCIYKDEKLLIYEFMPNKSLDFFLFDPRRRSELNWAQRFNIIHGVAKGLQYLHRDSSLRVIHRDLKASNILLDGKMNPKISDFGLARIFQETIDHQVNTHRVMGTIGYMSPEYAMGGMFSEKSDVYSFGVLVLEIVCGKKNNSFHYCDPPLSLVAHAWQLWSEGRALELLDEALLAESYSSSQVMRCIDIGLVCAQDHPTDRPTMPEVVFMLSNDQAELRKPRRPLFYSQSSWNCDLQPQVGTKCSANEASISMVEGR